MIILDNMDDMEKRVRVFFNECKRYQNSELPPNLEQEFKSIRKEYYKTLEDADEKVHFNLIHSSLIITLLISSGSFSKPNVRISRQILEKIRYRVAQVQM